VTNLSHLKPTFYQFWDHETANLFKNCIKFKIRRNSCHKKRIENWFFPLLHPHAHFLMSPQMLLWMLLPSYSFLSLYAPFLFSHQPQSGIIRNKRHRIFDTFFPSAFIFFQFKLHTMCVDRLEQFKWMNISVVISSCK